MTGLRGLAVALAACGLGVCAACGGGGGVGKVTQSTTTVTTVACDGSKTITVVTTPADGSTSTQGGIVGQGTPQTAGGFSTPTPVPTPRIVQGRIVLADVDSGSTIVVTVGTEILVALGPQTAPFCSSAPTTSDPGMLMQLSSSSGNDRSAHGRFVARSVGTALIEATIDPRCYPPCGAASARWQVTVEVIR